MATTDQNGNGNGQSNGHANGHSNGHTNGTSWWPAARGRLRGGVAPDDDALADYRRLALQLHYDLPRAEAGARSVLLATPRHSPLCAQGAAALACCLGEELNRAVLLIEASPRRPDVTRMMGCTERVGFSNLLADESLRFEDIIVSTTQPNVFFMPAGHDLLRTLSPVPAEDRLAVLLASMAQQFDFVLLYGGSVLDDSKALTVAGEVGCVLLMAIEQETRIEDLDAAENALSFCRPRKIGLVLTAPMRGRRWPLNGVHAH